MAQGDSKVGSDMYTVLILIAMFALIAGIVLILVKSQQLGYGNPFSSEAPISMLLESIRPITLS